MVKSLATLLSEHKDEIALTEDGLRIKCLITPHEMPARADVVEVYLNGNKFKKAKEWYSQDYSKYEPFLVQDKKNKFQLFCKITRLRVNKIPKDVEKHVNGKRFLRLKENYLEREARRRTEEDENDSSSDQEESVDEEDGVDIDVDEEAEAAAAAGVWMPKEELKAVVSGFKPKISPRKAKAMAKALAGKERDVEEEEQEEEEEEEEGDADDSDDDPDGDSIASDDSDADLRWYIREAPPASKNKGKSESKGKGKGKGIGKEDKMGKSKVSDDKQEMKYDENSEGKSKTKRIIKGNKEKEPASLKRGAGDSGKQSTTKKQKN